MWNIYRDHVACIWLEVQHRVVPARSSRSLARLTPPESVSFVSFCSKVYTLHVFTLHMYLHIWAGIPNIHGLQVHVHTNKHTDLQTHMQINTQTYKQTNTYTSSVNQLIIDTQTGYIISNHCQWSYIIVTEQCSAYICVIEQLKENGGGSIGCVTEWSNVR